MNPLQRVPSALRKPALFAATAALTVTATLALATAKVGQPAPEFTLSGAPGESVSLSDYRGRYVVLEWVNPGCPFVVKHYDSGNMPQLQKQFREKEVVWLTINSTNPSHRDYRDHAQMQSWLKQRQSEPSAMLLDPDGKVGHLYAAKATPHMFVIDPQGTLIYDGAIDDTRSADPADIPNSKNYVSAALNEALDGKPVSTPVTTPYGCSIKYSR